jgi:hypothetical protein
MIWEEKERKALSTADSPRPLLIVSDSSADATAPIAEIYEIFTRR